MAAAGRQAPVAAVTVAPPARPAGRWHAGLRSLPPLLARRSGLILLAFPKVASVWKLPTELARLRRLIIRVAVAFQG